MRLANLGKASGLNIPNTPFCTPTEARMLRLSLAPAVQEKTFNWTRWMHGPAPWNPTGCLLAQLPVISVQCRNNDYSPHCTWVEECVATVPGQIPLYHDVDDFMLLLLTQRRPVDKSWRDMVRFFKSIMEIRRSAKKVMDSTQKHDWWD